MYRDLPVSPEIKDIFKYIERYQPQNIELDFKLRPFIPDYIPSIGDIDAFIKVPRPDGKDELLGLVVVDEPSSNQSDPHVLDLFFRTLSKQSGVENVQPTVCITCYLCLISSYYNISLFFYHRPLKASRITTRKRSIVGFEISAPCRRTNLYKRSIIKSKLDMKLNK